MSLAFTFANFTPALASFRDQMAENYSACPWQPVTHRRSALSDGLHWLRAAPIRWSQGLLASPGAEGLPWSDRPPSRSQPSVRFCPTGLGQLNSSNPKEMSWHKRMSILLTEKGVTSIAVAG